MFSPQTFFLATEFHVNVTKTYSLVYENLTKGYTGIQKLTTLLL